MGIGFFNGRHESRWNVCMRFAELFTRQIKKVTGNNDVNADWGPLCGSPTKKRIASGHRLFAMSETENGEEPHVPGYSPEDNSILRLHIPFPCSAAKPNGRAPSNEGRAKDVVLFE